MLYTINPEGKVVYVDEKSSRFAVDNELSDFDAEKLLHHSILDFISEFQTDHFYQMILQKARADGSIQFKISCDAQDFSRILTVSVFSLENGDLQFDIQPVRIEKKMTTETLQKNISPHDGLIIICSWCNKVNVEEDVWQDLENAAQILKLDELEINPQLSHGMCNDCFQNIFHEG